MTPDPSDPRAAATDVSGLDAEALCRIARMAAVCEVDVLKNLQLVVHTTDAAAMLWLDVVPRWADWRAVEKSPHYLGSLIRLRYFAATAVQMLLPGMLVAVQTGVGVTELARGESGPRDTLTAHDVVSLRRAAEPVLANLIGGRDRWPLYRRA